MWPEERSESWKKKHVFGEVSGKKGRERSPTRWSDSIKARMGSVCGNSCFTVTGLWWMALFFRCNKVVSNWNLLMMMNHNDRLVKKFRFFFFFDKNFGSCIYSKSFFLLLFWSLFAQPSTFFFGSNPKILSMYNGFSANRVEYVEEFSKKRSYRCISSSSIRRSARHLYSVCAVYGYWLKVVHIRNRTRCTLNMYRFELDLNQKNIDSWRDMFLLTFFLKYKHDS